jgi:hypothetical protein
VGEAEPKPRPDTAKIATAPVETTLAIRDEEAEPPSYDAAADRVPGRRPADTVTFSVQPSPAAPRLATLLSEVHTVSSQAVTPIRTAGLASACRPIPTPHRVSISEPVVARFAVQAALTRGEL